MGDYAYVTNYDYLQVFDVSDPASPIPKLSPRFFFDPSTDLDYPGPLVAQEANAITVRLYIAGQYGTRVGMEIVDVNTATFEVNVRSLYLTNTSVRQIAVVGNFAYIGTREGLEVVEITDPAAMYCEHIFDEASINTGSYFAIQDNCAFVSNSLEGAGGLSVYYTGNDFFDLSDREYYEFEEHPPYMGVSDLDINGDTVVCTVRSAGLETFTFTPAGTLEHIGSYPVASEYLGLRIVDISNPAAPVEIGSGLAASYGTRSSRFTNLQVGLDVVGDYVFLPNFDGGILVADASNPLAPQKICNIPVTSDVIEMAAHRDLLYAAAESSGLLAIDITSPEDSRILSTYYEAGGAMGLDIGNTYVYLAVLVDGGHLFAASENATTKRSVLAAYRIQLQD